MDKKYQCILIPAALRSTIKSLFAPIAKFAAVLVLSDLYVVAKPP